MAQRDQLYQEAAALAPQPIADALLGWYDAGNRDLPWRREPTPYRVWVSEIMLQQTRVAAVLPYFARWMDALPTIPDLAAADEEVLHKLWEGLGYYSRVRNLKKAAQQVCQQFGGELPASYEALLTLPGIGEYTAGAIASIAFGLPVVAVDGNVLRVFARLMGWEEDITRPQVKRVMQHIVQDQQPKDRPGDFNQALMELGAMVCLPGGEPLCDRCPLASLCRGRELEIAAGLPVKSAKRPRRIEERTVLVLEMGEKVLLHRRPDSGLLAGLWELPNWEGVLSMEQLVQLVEELGATPKEAAQPMGKAKHIFTHLEWQMTGWRMTCAPFSPPEGYVWANRQELAQVYTLPTAFQFYREQLMGEPQQRFF